MSDIFKLVSNVNFVLLDAWILQRNTAKDEASGIDSKSAIEEIKFSLVDSMPTAEEVFGPDFAQAYAGYMVEAWDKHGLRKITLAGCTPHSGKTPGNIFTADFAWGNQASIIAEAQTIIDEAFKSPSGQKKAKASAVATYGADIVNVTDRSVKVNTDGSVVGNDKWKVGGNVNLNQVANAGRRKLDLLATAEA